MTFSENRYTLFRIMLEELSSPCLVGKIAAGFAVTGDAPEERTT
jgi:hypothetical protein